MGLKKLRRYSSQVVSLSLSAIPWSLYQLSMPLIKSQKFLYLSNEFQSKFGGFSKSVSKPFGFDNGLIVMFFFLPSTYTENSRDYVLVNNLTVL